TRPWSRPAPRSSPPCLRSESWARDDQHRRGGPVTGFDPSPALRAGVVFRLDIHLNLVADNLHLVAAHVCWGRRAEMAGRRHIEASPVPGTGHFVPLNLSLP